MAYVKEPDGVDFIIESTPLKDAERKEISHYIASKKELTEKGTTRPTVKRTKKV